MFISEATLFFKKEDSDLAIGLSLTIMLVMYTMYQSISLTLPATAYLKFIDIWMIFCLLLPFLVFVIQVFAKIKFKAENFFLKILNLQKQRAIWSKDCISNCIIILIPIFTVTFILCYICVAIIYFSNP